MWMVTQRPRCHLKVHLTTSDWPRAAFLDLLPNLKAVPPKRVSCQRLPWFMEWVGIGAAVLVSFKTFSTIESSQFPWLAGTLLEAPVHHNPHPTQLPRKHCNHPEKIGRLMSALSFLSRKPAYRELIQARSAQPEGAFLGSAKMRLSGRAICSGWLSGKC